MNNKAKYTLIGIGVGTLVSGLDTVHLKNIERLSSSNPFNPNEQVPLPKHVKKVNNSNLCVTVLKNVLIGGSIGYGIGSIKEGNK